MSRVFLFGDLHSNANSFKYRVKSYIDSPQPDDIIICLGDVGLQYGNNYGYSLRKAMSQFPGTIYVMRGNHDCRYWSEHVELSQTITSVIERPHEKWTIDSNLLYEKKYDNIKYIRDEGDILHINGQNILFIPGAYSVDKKYRLENSLPYEPHEQLTYMEQLNLLAQIEQFIQNNKIDYVCSHTAPLSIQPYFKDLFLDFIDQSTVDKSMEYFLDEVYNIIGKDVKRWYFGHYHHDRNVSTNFTMLYRKVVELGEKIE